MKHTLLVHRFLVQSSSLLGLLDHDDAGTALLLNISNYSPVNTV